jgi:hypothetical protein
LFAMFEIVKYSSINDKSILNLSFSKSKKHPKDWLLARRRSGLRRTWWRGSCTTGPPNSSQRVTRSTPQHTREI